MSENKCPCGKPAPKGSLCDECWSHYLGTHYGGRSEDEEAQTRERDAENARMDASPLVKLPAKPVEKLRGIRL